MKFSKLLSFKTTFWICFLSTSDSKTLNFRFFSTSNKPISSSLKLILFLEKVGYELICSNSTPSPLTINSDSVNKKLFNSENIFFKNNKFLIIKI